MNNPGQAAMWLGLIALCISSVSYIVLCRNKDNLFARKAARLSFIGFSAFVTIASMLLMHFILNHEFVYSYVARYSSRDLALEYLISSFWAASRPMMPVLPNMAPIKTNSGTAVSVNEL